MGSPLPSAKKCQGRRGCANAPTRGTAEEPRRFVHVKVRGRERALHVCRSCYDRWYLHGSFEPRRVQEWSASDEARVVSLRQRGVGVSEIRLKMPHVPRRTIYDMLHRAGIYRNTG